MLSCILGGIRKKSPALVDNRSETFNTESNNTTGDVMHCMYCGESNAELVVETPSGTEYAHATCEETFTASFDAQLFAEMVSDAEMHNGFVPDEFI